MVPNDIAQQVKDLSSGQFAVRDKAAKLLEQAGDQAGPALLRALLAKSSDLEHRRRVEVLLARLQPLTGERLRTLRAIEALERMGDASSKVLETLANGAPEALITQQAVSAWRRHGQ